MKMTDKQSSTGNVMPLREWQEFFTSRGPATNRYLSATYGDDTQLRERKRQQYLTALNHYERSYGPEDEVFLVRSPGRINLMGRHVDHRGGDVNVVAISDECIAVISPRPDDVIQLSNSMPERFAEHTFSISKLAHSLELSNWFTCINSPKTLALVDDGDWENYIKAAVLRLYRHFSDRALQGMRMTIHSNIPIGTGLSSSSALVVAAAEACIEVNDLPVQPHLLVDLCGEGEWFVGTRGGSGDHAAIKLGRRGEVVNMGFFPFEVKDSVPFPSDYRIVIIDSGIEAKKMQGARAEFNHRVLTYLAGEIVFKQTFPEHAEDIQHLRDIKPNNLGIDEAQMYRMLMEIPETLRLADLLERTEEMTREDRQRIETLTATGDSAEKALPVRDVLLYGIAEIERSRLCVKSLGNGDLEKFGRLCFTSHDGDRVVEHDANLQPTPNTYRVSDEYLHDLIARKSSDNPGLKESARLHWQPGRYACSLPEIDLIVDTAKQMDGVIGAQMAGAGLGGCVMAFVKEDRCGDIVDRFDRMGFSARIYTPVKGAGVVGLPG